VAAGLARGDLQSTMTQRRTRMQQLLPAAMESLKGSRSRLSTVSSTRRMQWPVRVVAWLCWPTASPTDNRTVGGREVLVVVVMAERGSAG
jgi:hypothetical protein